MIKKMYIINKVNISDGLIDTSSEVYNTKEERDKAWNILVHDHNELIRDAYCYETKELDELIDDYHYEWDDNELEFYCKDDPDMHRDYYKKDYDEVVIKDKVFVLLIDSYEGEGSSIIDMELFSSLEGAKKHLELCKEDFKNSIPNWNDTELYTIEEDDVSFTWFESGCYDENHYCINIYERTVYDGSIKLGGK